MSSATSALLGALLGRESSPDHKAIPLLYTLTAFLGASLIFIVEPLVTKLLLPHFGGASTLWATASLFFQAVLLGSYLLIHLTSRGRTKGQFLILLLLALTALLSLPLAYRESFSQELPTAARVLLTLAAIIGLPFALVATTGPITQRWYSLTDAPRASDPYFIYAASNVGSFVGLLSYPLVIEPYLTLKAQGILWSVLFIIFVLLLSLCYFVVRGSTKQVPASKLFSSSIPALRKVKWAFLAFVPSSLMLGVTTYVATDMGNFPLLWVVPLSIYLITMIVAFSRKSRKVSFPLLVVVTLLAVVFSTYIHFKSNTELTFPFLWEVAIVMTVFLITALAFHLTLAADRPEVEDLTSYFVIVSLGGALGGLFNGFLAPVIFTRVVELPLVFLLVPLLLVVWKPRKETVIPAVLCGAIMVGLPTPAGNQTLLQARTFYGAYKVEADANFIGLTSGTTVHGTQEKARPLEPTTYYSKGGPMGSLMKAKHFKNVAVVGLGAGTLAAYGAPGDSYHFIEIDEKVKEIAQDTRYFTFLKDSKASVAITIGDGRLELAELADGSVDLLVLDAFSSDSVPTHLLTEEAFALYRKKLAPGGVIAVHASNRFYDLGPVVASAADAMGVPLLAGNQRSGNAAAALWFTLTSDEELRRELLSDGWKTISGSKERWTDDYAPLLPLLYVLQ